LFIFAQRRRHDKSKKNLLEKIMIALLLKISALFPFLVMATTLFLLWLRPFRYANTNSFRVQMPVTVEEPLIQKMYQCPSCGIYSTAPCGQECQCDKI
jgi:hypothetical protein